MRDQLALAAPLFSAAGSGLVRSHDRAVDAPKFVIELLRIVHGLLQGEQNLLQGVVGTPAIEVVVDRLPRAELVGQVSPGRAGVENPEDSTHDQLQVASRSTRRCCRREQRLDQFPLLVRELMPNHPDSFREEERDSTCSTLGTMTRKYQFSDRA
jgi:hypothetical protein